MSALAQSYRTHADKIEKGQCVWTRGPNGYYHLGRADSLTRAAELRVLANGIEDNVNLRKEYERWD